MTDTESRTAKRLRVLKSAKLIFNNNQSVIDCGVRDLSATGAKLNCARSSDVPDEVRFMMIQDNTIRDARVMWRRGEQLGVHFTSDAVRAPARKF